MVIDKKKIKDEIVISSKYCNQRVLDLNTGINGLKNMSLRSYNRFNILDVL